MGVIIGATDALTGDYYSTWAKLRSPILGQNATSSSSYSTYSYQYAPGDGFKTSYGTLMRFDMRYDSTTWPAGFWRPTISFYESMDPTPGWYAQLFVASPSLTNEDISELTGETVEAFGTAGTFTIDSSFFIGAGQLIEAGSGFMPPYPAYQPVYSVGKLTPF
jgi:hypothetical protein